MQDCRASGRRPRGVILTAWLSDRKDSRNCPPPFHGAVQVLRGTASSHRAAALPGTIRPKGSVQPHALVQGHHAGGHVEVAHLTEAGITEHLGQGFLIGVHADGFGQVAIALGVVGDNLADEGQHTEGEGVVGTAQRLPYYRTKEMKKNILLLYIIILHFLYI